MLPEQSMELYLNSESENMKKIKAWWQVVEQDFNNFKDSPTVQNDLAELKADAKAMIPELWSAVEKAFANILIDTLTILA